jgi:hypothetical protein
MGLRFYRRVHLVPGVRLNISGSGPSISVGHRGAWLTLGSRGQRTATLGWPGTGLRYTDTVGGSAPPRAPSALKTLFWVVVIALVLLAVFT